MSHLLRRTKKSCLKFLRKISTSKHLFVQRLDEEDGDDEEVQVEVEVDLQRDLELDMNSNCPAMEAIYEELQLSECTPALDLAKEVEEPQQEPKHDLRTKYLMNYGSYEVLATLPSIEFERVNYKENVRYLRHTPSNSSLDLQLEEQQQEQLQQLQLQQQQPQVQQQQATPRKQVQQQRIPPANRYHPCSISLGSKFEGNYHNVVIMEPPHDDFPIVKWDINGNSLDDDTCDRWEDFDARWRQAAAVTRSLSQSQKSSHQSSSCTLETWVDDAEPLSLELHRHDSAATGNNCNLCLRSF
uniref:Uncharacterized protein LOC108039082 n=1 Tax=Drosophila rhopaloa TaxID=1041015 RepID=A0A6P4EDU1_DRORH